MYFITISRTGLSNLLAFGSHLPDPDQLPPLRADAESDDQRGRSAGSRHSTGDRRITTLALVVVAHGRAAPWRRSHLFSERRPGALGRTLIGEQWCELAESIRISIAI